MGLPFRVFKQPWINAFTRLLDGNNSASRRSGGRGARVRSTPSPTKRVASFDELRYLDGSPRPLRRDLSGAGPVMEPVSKWQRETIPERHVVAMIVRWHADGDLVLRDIQPQRAVHSIIEREDR